MLDDRERTVAGCAEYVNRALYALAIGPGSLPTRLAHVGVFILPLNPVDFPQDLRVQFAQLCEMLTAEDPENDESRLNATAEHMSEDRARVAADILCALAAEVARRDAIETQD